MLTTETFKDLTIYFYLINIVLSILKTHTVYMIERLARKEAMSYCIVCKRTEYIRCAIVGKYSVVRIEYKNRNNTL